MTSLRHPLFSELVREVPTDQVDRWASQGWQEEQSIHESTNYIELDESDDFGGLDAE